jgi:hypothetical protein
MQAPASMHLYDAFLKSPPCKAPASYKRFDNFQCSFSTQAPAPAPGPVISKRIVRLPSVTHRTQGIAVVTLP